MDSPGAGGFLRRGQSEQKLNHAVGSSWKTSSTRMPKTARRTTEAMPPINDQLKSNDSPVRSPSAFFSDASEKSDKSLPERFQERLRGSTGIATTLDEVKPKEMSEDELEFRTWRMLPDLKDHLRVEKVTSAEARGIEADSMVKAHPSGWFFETVVEKRARTLGVLSGQYVVLGASKEALIHLVCDPGVECKRFRRALSLLLPMVFNTDEVVDILRKLEKAAFAKVQMDALFCVWLGKIGSFLVYWYHSSAEDWNNAVWNMVNDFQKRWKELLDGICRREQEHGTSACPSGSQEFRIVLNILEKKLVRDKYDDDHGMASVFDVDTVCRSWAKEISRFFYFLDEDVEERTQENLGLKGIELPRPAISVTPRTDRRQKAQTKRGPAFRALASTIKRKGSQVTTPKVKRKASKPSHPKVCKNGDADVCPKSARRGSPQTVGDDHSACDKCGKKLDTAYLHCGECKKLFCRTCGVKRTADNMCEDNVPHVFLFQSKPTRSSTVSEALSVYPMAQCSRCGCSAADGEASNLETCHKCTELYCSTCQNLSVLKNMCNKGGAHEYGEDKSCARCGQTTRGLLSAQCASCKEFYCKRCTKLSVLKNPCAGGNAHAFKTSPLTSPAEVENFLADEVGGNREVFSITASSAGEELCERCSQNMASDINTCSKCRARQCATCKNLSVMKNVCSTGGAHSFISVRLSSHDRVRTRDRTSSTSPDSFGDVQKWTAKSVRRNSTPRQETSSILSQRRGNTWGRSNAFDPDDTDSDTLSEPDFYTLGSNGLSAYLSLGVSMGNRNFSSTIQNTSLEERDYYELCCTTLKKIENESSSEADGVRQWGWDWDSISPEHFSCQLSLYQWLVSQSIPLREYVRWTITKKKETDCPGLTKLIDHFNWLSCWVVTEVVVKVYKAERVTVLTKFLETVEYLCQLRNFLGAVAIVGALQSAPILRLTKTFEDLGKSWGDRLQAAMKFLPLSADCTAYRKLLSERRHGEIASTVPYPGLLTRDVLFFFDGNPTILAKSSPSDVNAINWRLKFAKISSSIFTHTECMGPLYSIRFDDSMISQLVHSPPALTADEAYDWSRRVEPKDPEMVIGDLIASEQSLKAQLQEMVRVREQNERLYKERLAYMERKVKACTDVMSFTQKERMRKMLENYNEDNYRKMTSGDEGSSGSVNSFTAGTSPSDAARSYRKQSGEPMSGSPTSPLPYSHAISIRKASSDYHKEALREKELGKTRFTPVQLSSPHEKLLSTGGSFQGVDSFTMGSELFIE